MPMTWDAAADAKLFTVVMAVYDIKISGAQNEKIAKMMGDDVTPKAITHRLSKIKAQASSFGSSTQTPSRKRGTPSKTPTTKAKSSNGKSLSATHTITTIMHDNGSDDEEDFNSPTNFKKRRFGNGKGPKIEYADEKGYYPGMGENEDDNGDAIDFSVGYTGNTNIKVEGKGKGGSVDLTGDVEVIGETVKVKKEVVEVEDGNEDDDEMAI